MLRDAVKAGELEGKGRGTTLRIRRGSYDDWMHQPGILRPEWADKYEVRPDSDERRTQADRRTLDILRDALSGASLLRLLGVEAATDQDCTLAVLVDRVGQGLAQGVGQTWQELRGVEIVVDEVAGEFEAGPDDLEETRRLVRHG
jgi:hypothetical protein